MCRVTCNNSRGAKAQSRQEHFHLFARGVLSLVENDERVVERSTAHEGKGATSMIFRSMYLPTSRNRASHRVRRKEGEIGSTFCVKSPGKKPSRSPASTAGERVEYVLRLLEQRLYCAGDGEIGFASACRTDAEIEVVSLNVFDVTDLAMPAWFNGAALGLDCFHQTDSSVALTLQ